MAINILRSKNIYPTMGSESIGASATGAVTGPTPEAFAAGTGSEELDAALTIGGQANPLVGLLVFAALVAAIMLIAQHLGGPDGFGNIKATAYNVLIVSLIAVAGVPVWKFVFTKFKVPGVSAWVHAA